MQPLNRLLAKIASSVALTLVAVLPTHAQNVTTVAGNDGQSSFFGENVQATAATVRLFFPLAVLARADGSVLIADTDNQRVRKIDVGGVITTFAGNGVGGFAGDTGPATAAQIRSPASLIEDAAGNVYIGSRAAIRKVTPAGVITTIAGTGTPGNSGDSGLATAAEVNWVMGMGFDSAGNLFFTDYFSHVVRKIDAGTGVITRIAGTGSDGAFVANNVAALSEPLSSPAGILVQADGSLIVAVGGQRRVRKIIPGGNITTLAGNGTPNSTGDNNPAAAATLNFPWGLAADGAGGYFVAEINGHRVRKIAASGIITTVIGNGTATNTGDNDPASAATIRNPAGLSRASSGNLFIVSYGGHTIRKIAFAPLVTTPGPSVFNAYVNTTTASLGSVSPAGEQTVAFGGVVNMTVTANPRHVLRVASNCEYVQTNAPMAFVPNGTGVNTYAVTVNGPCQMEATFTPLIPKTNVNSEMAANALFMATERALNYTPSTLFNQTTSTVGQAVTFKAWVTDIAGVSFPSATNVITFKTNGVAISGCSNVPLTLRNSDVIHIREASCTTSFAAAGSNVITTEFAGDTYNFPAASSGLNPSVNAAP